MKLPHLLQVSLLVCVVSVVAGTQRSMAATSIGKIDSALSFSPARAIQVSDIFSNQPSEQPSWIALYQAVSDGELRKYAMAVIAIEPLRLEALQAIKSKVGSVPSLMCHQPGNLDALPADARRIFVKHCDRASSIAAQNGLSMDSFNRITAAVSADAGLRSKLQSMVNRLQGG
jgi:Domain of unknown function (DUF4168)